MKGVRIEKGPTFWHVSIKRSDNRQGYVEVGKFITFEAAIEFAREQVKEAA